MQLAATAQQDLLFCKNLDEPMPTLPPTSAIPAKLDGIFISHFYVNLGTAVNFQSYSSSNFF